MSVQIALGAPATRVASRKLGPVAGSRAGGWRRVERRRPPARRARWRARAAGARPSPGSGRGSRRRSRSAARRARAASRCSRSYRTPEVTGVGVRYQVAPRTDRRARARRPRLGARQRVPADEPRVVVGGDDRALGRADVGDDAVRGRRVQRLGDESGRPPTGTATNTASRPGDRLGDRARRARSSAPRSERALDRLRGAVVAGDRCAPSRSRRREPDRAADQPDAEDRNAHAARRLRDGLTPGPDRRRELVEHGDGRPPSRCSRR